MYDFGLTDDHAEAHDAISLNGIFERHVLENPDLEKGKLVSEKLEELVDLIK